MVGTKPENHNCDNYDAFSERLKMRASQPRMTFGNLPEAMNTNLEQGNVLKKPKQPSIYSQTPSPQKSDDEPIHQRSINDWIAQQNDDKIIMGVHLE